MLELLLPPGIALAEADRDIDGELLEPERAVIAKARRVRRREFITGRVCARRALAQLEIAPTPLARRSDGSVDWPAGIVGSITHCSDYRAAAVGRSQLFAGVGIDAEPNEPLPHGVLDSIAGHDERSWLRDYPAGAVHWDRLLFSAKESVVKAVDAPIRDWRSIAVRIFPRSGTFVAHVTLDRSRVVPGRWTAVDRHVGTAVIIPRAGS